MQQKEVTRGAAGDETAPKEVPAPKPVRVVEKRKTRSHGSAEELQLPPPKRSHGKSKSPPSVTDTGEDRSAKQQEAEQDVLPHSSDQVPLRDFIDCLIGGFSHLDSLERVQEVCTQEKAISPPTPKPMT